MRIAGFRKRNLDRKPMNSRIFLTVAAALLIPSGALAQSDPYTDLNKQVQETLRERGFYSGPVNGDVGPNTQAAIAQFQLSWPLPVSGMLDADTLAALGIQPAADASAGASAEAPQQAAPAAEAEVKAN
jgi:peptidoglycan hydrolase-like protein with peptidoglycan-binding domain